MRNIDRSAQAANRARAHALSPALRPDMAPWVFRLLHMACFLLVLPLVAASRLPSGKQRARPAHGSIFAETNDEVLVVLGIGFSA